MQSVPNIIFVVIMIIGVFAFVSGLHGIDNAWNIKYINYQTGREFIDYTVFGYGRTADEIYNQSILLAVAGFYISVIAALCLEECNPARTIKLQGGRDKRH